MSSWSTAPVRRSIWKEMATAGRGFRVVLGAVAFQERADPFPKVEPHMLSPADREALADP